MLGKNTNERRKVKEEIVHEMAELAIQCKNGGSVLAKQEIDLLTNFLGRISERMLVDRDFSTTLMSAKGFKSPPAGLGAQNVNNFYDLIRSVEEGGCGQSFVKDIGRWAQHIVDSNPSNDSLRNKWTNGQYESRLTAARVDAENERASFMERPTQRMPLNEEEATGHLAYWAGDASVTDEKAWLELRDTVIENFKQNAILDKDTASLNLTWAANISKYTYKAALAACVKNYGRQSAATVRLTALQAENQSGPSAST